MKRILALVLAFCMLVPFTAFAATEEVSTVAVGSTYNVYIEGYSSATNVSIMLRNSDATDIAYVGEVKPDIQDRGKYATKFKLSVDPAQYGVYVRDITTGEDISESVKTAVATDELYTVSLDVSVDASDRAYVVEGDAIDVSVNIKNKYGDNSTMKVLAAAYGENNQLLATNVATVAALFDDLTATKETNNLIKAPIGTKKVKAFIWNSAETMIPVAPSKMIINEDNAITVHLAGDSLCTIYGYNSYPQYGWGQCIGNYFADGVKVNNQAISGWSTFSFLYKDRNAVKGSKYKNVYGSPYYKGIISKINPGDYVMISFGINDLMQTSYDVYETADGRRYVKTSDLYYEVTEYDDEEGTATVSATGVKKADIGADITRTYTVLSNPEEYKANLKEMIRLAKEAGATPILMSSTGHYRVNTVGKPVLSNEKLDDYFVYMEEVANEEGVEFIDLYTHTDAIYTQWGNLTRMDTVQLNKHVIDWFVKYDPEHVSENRIDQYTKDPNLYDVVHYNYNGANWVASQIAKLIYESNSSIKELVNEPDIYDIPMQWNEKENEYRASLEN